MLSGVPVWLTGPALAVASIASIAWLARRATADRLGTSLIAASVIGRTAMATLLYLAARHACPLLPSLQWQGFWLFGLDSRVYHHFGVQIANAWAAGIELPDPEMSFEYFAVVGAVYRLLGAQPIYPILVNCWMAGLTALLAYLLARELFDRRAARWASGLVGFWPSSWIWSGMLMKDPLGWLLMFAALWLVLSVLRERLSAQTQLPALIGRMAALAVAAILVTRCRFYLGFAFALAAVAVCLPAAIVAGAQQRVQDASRYAAVLGILVAATLFSRGVDALRLLSPPSPETGHMKLAMQWWREHEFDRAESELQTAVGMQRGYRHAWQQLIALDVHRGRLDRAVDRYTEFLQTQESAPSEPLSRLQARVALQQGDAELQAGQVPAALAAYAQAIALDVLGPSDFADRVTRLAERSDFAAAFALLERAQERPTDDSRVPLLQAEAFAHLRHGDVALGLGAPEAVASYGRAVELLPSLALIDPPRIEPVRADAYFERLMSALQPPAAPEAAPAAALRTALMVRLCVERGDAKLAEGELAQAVAAYWQAVRLQPRSIDSVIRCAMALDQQGAYAQAVELLSHGAVVMAQAPDVGRIVQLMARVLVNQADADVAVGRIEPAVAAYGRALTLDASIQPVFVSRAYALAQRRYFAESMALLELAKTGPIHQDPAPAAAPEMAVGAASPSAAMQALPEEIASEPAHADAAAAAVGLVAPTAPAVQAPAAPIGSIGVLVPMRPDPAPLQAPRPPPPAAPLPAAPAMLPVAPLERVRLELQPETVDAYRQGFVGSGGYSLVDPMVRLATLPELVRYIPRGMTVGLLAPFPKDWLRGGGSTGVMRQLAGLEMFVLYLLLPAIVGGLLALARSRRIEGWFVLALLALAAVSISLVVANLGTLFRLRLQFVLPLLVLAAGGDPRTAWGRLWGWARRAAARVPRQAPRLPVPQAATTVTASAAVQRSAADPVAVMPRS
jgi:tetratricopeptide (TPR) repeat protein